MSRIWSFLLLTALPAMAAATCTSVSGLHRVSVLELYTSEDRLSSQVTAGENRGKRLQHDFVVRSLVGSYAVGPERKLHFRHTFPLGSNWKASELSVAAVAQNAVTGEVLQALAIRTCR